MSLVRTPSFLSRSASLFALAAVCGVLVGPGSEARAAEVQIGAELGHSVIDTKSSDR
jgi:hypothetical protein